MEPALQWRTHSRLLLCLLFIYILSNLESVHHHIILSGFVSPTSFRFVGLRIHIAPIKLCRLFAYAQISTIFAATTMSLFAILSLSRVALAVARGAQSSAAPSITNEIILLFIFVLVHSECIPVFCIQKGKQSVASRASSIVSALHFSLCDIFSSIFLLLSVESRATTK